jgi:MFS family permease
VSLFLHFLLYRPSLEKELPVEKKEGFSSFLKLGGTIWILGLIWMWYNAGAIAFSTFGPDFFLDQGLPLAQAGLLASIVTWGSLFFSPLIGYLMDREVKGKHLLLVGCFLLSLSFLILSHFKWTLFIPLGLLGFAAGLVPAPIYYLVPRIVPISKVGLGYGVIMTALNAGVLLGPYLAGWAKDEWGYYGASLDTMAILCLLATFFSWILKSEPKISR